MENENRNAVIVFTRYPFLGKVKTRLAAETNDEFAHSFYKTCAEHTFSELDISNEHKFDIYIFVSEGNELDQIKYWTENKFSYCTQEGNNLGERMLNAFKKIYSMNYEKVIIIGTDAPDISGDLMLRAFTVLDKNDCVIGPANDGGYYLLGFRDKVIDLFSGINWSTASVFDKTIERITQHRVNYSLLEELIDVDTITDLKKWHSKFRGDKHHPIQLFVRENKSHLL